jgi:hypothetical protein
LFWSLCYVVLRRVLQLAALRFRSKEFKELEIVVLRHELAVLRRKPDGIARIRESADAELVLREREAGAQGRVGDNEVTTSEASLSAPSTRLGRESHRYGNEVAAPTNGSPLSSGKSPAGRRGNQRRFLESRLRSPAQCTSLRHRE